MTPKLNLQFDGVNGATSTVDSTGRHTSLSFQGAAEISTARGAAGSASSLRLDSSQQSYLRIADSPDWRTSADWVWEFWVYPGNVNTRQGLISTQENGVAYGDAIEIEIETSGYIFAFFRMAPSPASNYVEVRSAMALIASAWNKVAIVKSGGTLSVWLNDVQGTGASMSGSIYGNNFNLLIGRYHNTFLDGYIDNVVFMSASA